MHYLSTYPALYCTSNDTMTVTSSQHNFSLEVLIGVDEKEKEEGEEGGGRYCG